VFATFLDCFEVLGAVLAGAQVEQNGRGNRFALGIGLAAAAAALV
jgi:hypothetical protein